MKDCPTCLAPVDGLTCPKCGYTEDPNPERPAGPRPPWLDDRWASVAELVEATRLQSVASARRDEGADPRSCVEAAKRLAENLTRGPKDPRAWARRILERDRAGEVLTVLSIENAYEALRLNRPDSDGSGIDAEIAVVEEPDSWNEFKSWNESV